MYTEEEKSDTNSGDHIVKKPTLSQRLDKLTELIELMNTRFDNLEKDISSLKQDIKDINARLDYNGLKQLPSNK